MFEGNFTILCFNLIMTGVVIDCRIVRDGNSDLGVPRLKSGRVGPRS